MKKISLLLIAVMLLGIVPISAEDDAAIVQTFECIQSAEQGMNNFYYCQFSGDTATELAYDATNKRWNATPNGLISATITPGNTCDVGFVFKAPTKGVVRLESELMFPWAGDGDGVTAYIKKGGETLWTQNIPHDKTGSYKLEITVRAGEEIFFCVNANNGNGYDQLRWWPTVSYVAKAYSGSGGKNGYRYLQKMNGELSELSYDAENDIFNASDGVAFMSDFEMMPSDNCSLITRYTIQESGKYRVSASLEALDRRNCGNIVYVYKNGKLMWQQLVPANEEGVIDVRFNASKDDIIDVEVKKNDYAGFNYSDWKLDIKRYEGSQPFSTLSTSSGANYGVEEEFSLSSKIGASQGSGAEYYAIYNDTKFPMTYNAGNKTWIADVMGDATCKISPEAVTPGNLRGDPMIDVDIVKDGTMKIEGKLPVSETTSGLLVKILLNGNEIWCNRVGGERSIRYDEEGETSLFINDINVVFDVKEGDKLTFSFERWRLQTAGVGLNIQDISLKYIVGEMLSQTTEWKIKQSVIFDTEASVVYFDGKKKNVNLIVENGTSYLAEADAKDIPGFEVSVDVVSLNGTNYIPVRKTAEAKGKAVNWGADRFIAVYDGISLMFGIPEFTEMKAALKGGVLID